MNWDEARIRIPAQPFLTLHEVLALTDVSKRTLRRWIAEGRFPQPCSKGRWAGMSVGVWLALQGYIRMPTDSESGRPGETPVKGKTGAAKVQNENTHGRAP